MSRTWWHGIRGGSNEPGWSYGWSGVWKTALGTIALGLLIPWSMTRLWNERWSSMTFGPHPFEANASSEGLLGRWLLIYLTPFVGALLLILVGLGGGLMGTAAGGQDGAVTGAAMAIMVGTLVFYVIFLVVSLSFWALFYRHVVDATSLAGIDFEFNARTSDWLKLILGNTGLVIVTLGVGLLFLSYRNWSFLVAHMEARGTIDLEQLTQSTTRTPTDAEGLADAFDFGAI